LSEKWKWKLPVNNSPQAIKLGGALQIWERPAAARDPTTECGGGYLDVVDLVLVQKFNVLAESSLKRSMQKEPITAAPARSMPGRLILLETWFSALAKAQFWRKFGTKILLSLAL